MFDPIPAYPIPACRDRSRHPGAKARAMGRRADRVAKSARLFLAFVFPANMGGAV